MLGDLRNPGTPVHLGRDGNEDWPKRTVDLTAVGGRVVRNQGELLQVLREEGTTVEHFKTLPSYQRPLLEGGYPWLAGL